MIAPGSLALCVNDTFHPESMRLIPNRPHRGQHYFVREIEEYYGTDRVGVRLEEIQNPHVRFNNGEVKEPSFDIDRFSFEDDVDLSEIMVEAEVNEETY
jgi:hypothetical protein